MCTELPVPDSAISVQKHQHGVLSCLSHLPELDEIHSNLGQKGAGTHGEEGRGERGGERGEGRTTSPSPPPAPFAARANQPRDTRPPQWGTYWSHRSCTCSACGKWLSSSSPGSHGCRLIRRLYTALALNSPQFCEAPGWGQTHGISAEHLPGTWPPLGGPPLGRFQAPASLGTVKEVQSSSSKPGAQGTGNSEMSWSPGQHDGLAGPRDPGP